MPNMHRTSTANMLAYTGLLVEQNQVSHMQHALSCTEGALHTHICCLTVLEGQAPPCFTHRQYRNHTIAAACQLAWP